VDDAQTRAVFPFAFELDVRFRVAHAALYCVATVRNRGETAMPASLGFHPAFRWPLQGAGPREGHQIRFAQTEPAAVRRLDAQGLLRPLSESSPVQGRILSLDDALFEKDVVIFDRLQSRSLRYADDSGRGIDIEFPDASYLGVWTRPGAPFVCIEPWRGIADPQGFDGDLADKPGVELLAGPGDSFDLTMVLKLRTAVLEPGDA
jgi:galactose mutarotase-like enzyme